MKYLLLLLIFTANNLANAQFNFLEGTWQGIVIKNGQNYANSNAVWFNFEIDSDSKQLKGMSRVEEPFTKNFAIKLLKGKVVSDKVVELKENFLGLQKNTGSKSWCLLNTKLVYNDSTGYLEGSFSSTDCRSYGGKIILFRSKHKISKNDEVTLYHSWFNNFVNDLNRGWAAYYVRSAEMKNFVFKPVYFNHDKDIVKQEYYDYLKQMVKIVKSHTDLRIKIIGHTDSNGSDAYNVGLSKRRADNIKAFLMAQGIKGDKIVIEFRGEKDPAVSNATSKGKQLNRRVDFEFI